MITTIDDLLHALTIAPVMGNFHPLISLCLPADVEIITDPLTLIIELDAPTPHQERPVLLTHYDPHWTHRFAVIHHPASPPPNLVNENLPFRLETARQCLPTSHTVANIIANDARQRGYETVILLLVDGLSYADTQHWPEQPMPCLIDGPSITFSRTNTGETDNRVGFPAIIGQTPLVQQLITAGLPHSRGYSYWEREQNDVSQTLFAGIPLEKIPNFEIVFERITQLNPRGLYIQIVRQGLDGLAHGHREVTPYEIQASVDAIHHDFERLADWLKEKAVFGAVYLIADHGILWKNQHKLQLLPGEQGRHPRYNTELPKNHDLSTVINTRHQTFYLWQYPYLAHPIKSNDSGVHGGLSYWESLVPFVRVEVKR